MTLFNVKLWLVAPGILAELNRHWKVNGVVPFIVTLKLAVCPWTMVWLSGCAGTEPTPLDEPFYEVRAVTRERDGVAVTAAPLGDQEGRAVFGMPLGAFNIQPVWIKIENLSAYHGPVKGTLLDSGFQEYDLKTGKVLSTWDSP